MGKRAERIRSGSSAPYLLLSEHACMAVSELLAKKALHKKKKDLNLGFENLTQTALCMPICFLFSFFIFRFC